MGIINKYKKSILLFLTLTFSIGIIVLAFKWDTLTENKTSFEATPLKNVLEIFPDGVPQERPTLAQRGLKNERVGTTTVTELMARDMLVEYALNQQGMGTTTMSDLEAEVIATRLIQQASVSTEKPYTLKELNISSENTSATATTYANSLAAIVNVFNKAHTDSELAIVGEALQTQDAKGLTKLTPIIATYRQLEKSLLALKTPSLVAPLHLRLIQNYANIRYSVEMMQGMFTDTAAGLISLSQHKEYVDELNNIAREYTNFGPPKSP